MPQNSLLDERVKKRGWSIITSPPSCCYHQDKTPSTEDEKAKKNRHKFNTIRPLDVAPCKGIRNPESNIFLPLESGILGFGIRNPVPGIRNPTRGIRNPASSMTMESWSGMYYTVSSKSPLTPSPWRPLPLLSPKSV